MEQVEENSSPDLFQVEVNGPALLDTNRNSHPLVSGNYFLPEIDRNITVAASRKDKITLCEKIYGKGTVNLSHVFLTVSSYSGDLEVNISNSWILQPFVNEARSLTIKDSTIFLDSPFSSAIINRGLKLVLSNVKLICVYEPEANCTLLLNEGELFQVSRLSSYLHFGHVPYEHSLVYAESNRGEFNVVQSGLLLTTACKQKPVLLAGRKSLLKLDSFSIASEREFLPTRLEECSINFSNCTHNEKNLEQLAPLQEVVGTYESHMSGRVEEIGASTVQVNTDKAPVTLQLPLQCKHNTVIVVERTSSSEFPVKIRSAQREFVLGAGNARPCSLALRFSSRGWVERTGDVTQELSRRTEQQSKSHHRHKTVEHKSRHKTSEAPKKKSKDPQELLKKGKTLLEKSGKSKQMQEKFRKGREKRRELLN